MAKKKSIENEQYMIEFWDRLNKAIRNTGMNQTDFIKSIGLNDNQFSLCKVRCAEIRIYTVFKIIQAANIDANWLFYGNGNIKEDMSEFTKYKIKDIIRQLEGLVE
jgi:hypothetical protein